MNEEPQLDLDWQAFRYISDEMSEAEMDQFEALLGEQQAAREAVADAVELWCALGRLRPAAERAPQRANRRWMQPAAWLIPIAAACLLVAFFAYQSVRQAPHVPGFEPAELDSLARAWTSNALSSADEPTAERSDESDLDLSETFTAFELDEEFAAFTAEDDVTTLSPPQWMMAAVRTDLDPEAENEL